MSLIIRNIEKGDYKEVEILTREAFWNVYRPGCSEHLVLHNLHQNNKSIEDLELVVECDGKIVGHIVYSKGYIDGLKNETFITFGPISVHPNFQKNEIGSTLIRISMQKALRLGFSAVFITGNPDYYKKFGFESASKYGVHLQGVPATEEAPFFMVRTLKEDVLKDIEGYFVFDECYNVDQDDVDEFDKNFEPKKKEVRDDHLG